MDLIDLACFNMEWIKQKCQVWSMELLAAADQLAVMGSSVSDYVNVIDHRAGQLAARRRKVLYTDFEAFLPTKLIYIIYKTIDYFSGHLS